MKYDAMGERVHVRKIVSGGQTGVDRAALDAALDLGVEAGGWCPHGRLAEDGPIDRRYPLEETPSGVYAERTTWNVRDSDGTLVIASGEPVGGTLLTVTEARRLSKPCLVVDPVPERVTDVRNWMREFDVRVLNVAGPREAEEPGIYESTRRFLRDVLA